ncbi:MAG: hypothetical protein HW413_2142 [Thermoleophilia bacterium]|nr:hypothetical protein [Thermoleophilia bacterium]
MDPEQHADAKARLERDYLAGAISAEEYTRLRRQLHESASAQEGVQEQEKVQEQESSPAQVAGDPLAGFQGAVPAGADPVTGAHLASWGRRAAGWFVDVMVLLGAWVAIFAWASTTEEDPATGEWSATAGFVFFVVFFLGPPLYQWLMIGRWGQTLGKMALGIRVVRSEDADRVSYPRALGRASSLWVLGTFGWILLGLPLLLAYLWPLWDKRNQTLYDKMASTIVVKDR